MDTSNGDSSADGLFQAGSHPSPTPPPRGNAPLTPKEGGISSSLPFRLPPRPGSSMRKGRKSDFNSPAPPPLPTSSGHDPMPLSETTNFEGYNFGGPSSSTPSRPSSSSSTGHGAMYKFSASAERAQEALVTTRQCRQKLQALREENQNQVNTAGLLGAGLLELRSRIEGLMDELAEELGMAENDADNSHDNSSRIQELSERIEAEIEEMESQKQKLYQEVMAHGAAELSAPDQSVLATTDSPSKAARVASAIKNLTGTTPHKAVGGASGTGMPTPRQGDRRLRNAAARQAKADSELINEIQAGLVQEVRRLQGLLKERDDQRASLERTNAELEKQLDLFKPRVIELSSKADALEQENWDLLGAKQSLEEELAERDTLLKKAELENIRLTKDLGKAHETIDSQRLEIDAHLADLEKRKKQRETEVAIARKERAGMQRDVSDLQTELQKFKAQQLNRGGAISRSVSNSYVSEQDEEADADANDPETLAARLRAAYANEAGNQSPGDSVYSEELGPRSPLVSRLGRDKEAQDLRAKLAMAQKKAGKDAAEKRKMREANAELKKLLLKVGVKLPTGLDDDDDVESSEDEELHWLDDHDSADSPSVRRMSSKLRPTKSIKRPSMAKRLGLTASNSTDSIVEADEKVDDEASEGDRTMAKALVGDDSTSVEGSQNGSPRASLDGIDPAFADVMQPGFGTPGAETARPKRQARKSAAAAKGSPLAQSSTLADIDDSEMESPPRPRRRQQGRRSDAQARPSSLVFEPSALGNELENLRGSEDLGDSENHLEGTMEGVQEQLQSFEEAGVVTDPQPDLVGPALLERDRLHLAELERLRQEHSGLLSARTEAHERALLAAREEHENLVVQLKRDHDGQLVEKDRAFAERIASTLADRTKIHEAALAEARSRHSRALADQVATSSAALGAAIAAHKTSVETQEQRHKEDHQRREASHLYALSQKDRQHRESVRDLEDAHASRLAELETTHQKALEASEEALQKARVEIDSLKATVEDLNARLEAALEDMNARHEAAMEDLKARLEAAIEDLNAQLKAANDKATLVETQREEEGETHRTAVASFEQQLKAAAAAAVAAKAEHESEVARLQANISDLETRLALTEQRASSVQSERDAASSEAIKKAQADVDGFKAACLAAEARLKATEQHATKQQTEMQTEIETKRVNLENLTTKLQRAENKVQLLESEAAAQQEKLSQTASEVEQASVLARQHEEHARKNGAQADNQRALVQQLTGDLAHLRKQVEEQSGLRKEAEQQLASLLGQANLRLARMQREAEEAQSLLQRNAAAEQARLRQEAEEEHQRLRREAEGQARLREEAEARAAAATAAAAAAAAAVTAAANAPTTVGAVDSELGSREPSDGGHVTEAETDTEQYEDALDHIRTTSIDRPADVRGVASPPLVRKERKDNSSQTDDLIWASYQDEMARSVTPEPGRPRSSMTNSTHNDNVISQGGTHMLGGHRYGRPRDSVGTFGGHREESLRIDSPAPTISTLATGRPSRRGSSDSTWSRQTDRANINDIPPVPPLPDKNRTTMASMPPPFGVPTKRAPSISNVHGSPSKPPPRPTSPPPSDLLARAAQRSTLLQVPYGGGGSNSDQQQQQQPRSVSRASTRSGVPSRPYTGGSQRSRQQSSAASMRERTYSAETNASLQRSAGQLEGNIYSATPSGRKSVGSRRSAAGSSVRRGVRGPSSAASFVSDVTSEVSRRFSLASSQASEDVGDETFIARPGARAPGVSEYGASEGTDPMVIHAITQGMIGAYMFKYTRKSMGRGGHSDKRHRRYFWMNPFTKMLYWTINDPGGNKVSEETNKSAYVYNVKVIDDTNPSPPGLYHQSLLITTARREVKITAPNREQHETWLGAFDFLVKRPAIHDAATVANEVGAEALMDVTEAENNGGQATRSLGRRSKASGTQRPSMLTAQRSFLSRKSTENMSQHERTPRKRGSSIGASSVIYQSIGKRRDLPAREWLQQQEREREISMSPSSSMRRGVARSTGAPSRTDPDDDYDHLLDLNEPTSDPRLQTAEEMLEEDEEEGFDGLDNVRACCDGKHDVGALAHDHTHIQGSRRPKRHGRQSSGGARFSNTGLRSKLDAAVRAAEERERPSSPSLPPQLSLNLPPKESVAASMGISSPPLMSEGARQAEMRSVSQPGPSYGERVQKIRQARQSASAIK